MRLDRDLGGWWWLERWSCLVSADTAGGAVASARHGKSNLLHSGEQLGLSRELVAAIATSAGHHVKRKHLGVRYGETWIRSDRTGWGGWVGCDCGSKAGRGGTLQSGIGRRYPGAVKLDRGRLHKVQSGRCESEQLNVNM